MQLLDDVQDFCPPLQRHQRKFRPSFLSVACALVAFASLLLLVATDPKTPVSWGLPREEVLWTLEGTCSHAYFPSHKSQIELGTACGKLFRCSTMAILDAGDSDILSDQQA